VFQRVPPGRFVIILEDAGFTLNPSSTNVDLLGGVAEAGEVCDLGRVVIDGGNRLRGSVAGPNGRPLAGVLVQLEDADLINSAWETTTDSAGQFGVPVPQAFEGALTLFHREYTGAVISAGELLRGGGLDVRLGAPSVVRLRIAGHVDYDDYVWIKLHAGGGALGWRPAETVVRESTGAFVHELRGCPAGRLRVVVGGSLRNVGEIDREGVVEVVPGRDVDLVLE
jgi:hypothetical protein